MDDKELAEAWEHIAVNRGNGLQVTAMKLYSALVDSQKQNRQMRETLDWIDEYRELNMTIAMNEWEEAAAFKAVEDRVTATLLSLQDT